MVEAKIKVQVEDDKILEVVVADKTVKMNLIFSRLEPSSRPFAGRTAVGSIGN